MKIYSSSFFYKQISCGRKTVDGDSLIKRFGDRDGFSSSVNVDAYRKMLFINTSLNGDMFKSSWGSIKEDGSGRYREAVKPDTIYEFPTGTFKNLYLEAKQVVDKNSGFVPDIEADKIAKKFLSIKDNEEVVNGCTIKTLKPVRGY